MKKTIISIMSLTIISFSIFFWQTIYGTVNNNQTDLSVDSIEIKALVDEFWLASLQGDDKKVKELLSYIPPNFYEKTNQCDRENGETDERLNSSQEGLLWITKGVNNEQFKSEYDNMLRFSAYLKKEQFDSYKILAITETDNDAKVKFEYGKGDFRPRVELFLLSKTNKGNWKIFMNTFTWYLNSNNKYFAAKNCSE